MKKAAKNLNIDSTPSGALVHVPNSSVATSRRGLSIANLGLIGAGLAGVGIAARELSKKRFKKNKTNFYQVINKRKK